MRGLVWENGKFLAENTTKGFLWWIFHFYFNALQYDHVFVDGSSAVLLGLMRSVKAWSETIFT